MNWFKLRHKDNIPLEFQWYKEAVLQKDTKRRLFTETRFVVLDTETTGLNPKTDRILSIGGIAINNLKIDLSDSFEAYVQQELVGKESIPIHEITPQRSAKGLQPKEAITQFLKWLDGSIVIGHYVDFDFKILSEACKRNLGFHLLNKRYDTMKMIKRVDQHFSFERLNKPEDWGLEELCKRYNLPITDRHTAPGDAMATALLFIKLLKKLEHRGVKTVGELLAR